MFYGLVETNARDNRSPLVVVVVVVVVKQLTIARRFWNIIQLPEQPHNNNALNLMTSK
jgi:hypothetical protein